MAQPIRLVGSRDEAVAVDIDLEGALGIGDGGLGNVVDMPRDGNVGGGDGRQEDVMRADRIAILAGVVVGKGHMQADGKGIKRTYTGQ